MRRYRAPFVAYPVNILFCSVPFRPSIGGLESVSAILAERFHARGHRVVLVTQTPGDGDDEESYTIVRRPGPRELFGWVRWADVVFHNNVSLRLAWPQLLLRRPWVIAHHVWTPRSGRGTWVGRLKRWSFRFAGNIAVSRAIADSIGTPATIIGNPYAEDRFKAMPGIARDRDVVFLGRLVSDKGLPVLLEALAVLAARGVRARLTVVGGGPEEAALRAQTQSLGLAERVWFAGPMKGEQLAGTLNAHRALVVPSVWEEPFGVVALEGLACGCVPIVTRSGGLPDAVGRCGIVVPKNDPGALAAAIEAVLADAAACESLLAHATEHLAAHTRDRVARQYLDVLEHACRGTH
jgi:glycosyltransferase involved in cell wall biosynthesis